MIEGSFVRLVAFEPQHGVKIYDWMNDPAYLNYFRNMPLALSIGDCSNFPQIMGMNVLMVVEKRSSKVIGLVSWDNIRALAKTCEIGILVDKDAQGAGVTKDAFMHFLWYLCQRLGFHKVSANVVALDSPTVSKCKWGGMIQEGYRKEYFFLNGRWHDEIILSVIDREFAKRFKRYREGEASWEEKAGEDPHIKAS